MIVKIPRFLWIGLAASLVLGEVAVQLFGIVDVPAYERDNQIGYIPAPNQSGAFMRTHTWRFNELSMGAGDFTPNPSQFNLLLVGDSIVLGGNPLAESERLGPQLEKLTGWQIWPISAGSWALLNELAYMRQHPQVLDRVDAVVIISNSGDFAEPSSWVSDLTHPLHHPFPGLLYVIRKYVLPPFTPQVMPEMKVALRNWQTDLHEFSQSFHKPIYIFMYPDINELHDRIKLHNQLDAKIPIIQSQTDGKVLIFNIANTNEWNDSLYRDNIHPNIDGNVVLSSILYKDICKSALTKMACR
jgi:hypothetical protein